MRRASRDRTAPRSLSVIAAALCLGSLLASPRGLAAPDEQRAAAERVAAEGQRLHQAGRYALALDRFQEAQRVYASADLLVYIAASLLSLERDHEAVGALIEFFPDAARSTAALRALATRVWQDTSAQARTEQVGPGGVRLGPVARRRLAQAEQRFLPPELQGITFSAAAPAQPDQPPLQSGSGAPRGGGWTEARWPGLTLGGLGLTSVVAGAALVAIHDTCATPGDINICARVYATQAGGISAVVLGSVALLGGGSWLIAVSLRARHASVAKPTPRPPSP